MSRYTTKLRARFLAAFLAGGALTACGRAPDGLAQHAVDGGEPPPRSQNAPRAAQGRIVYERHCLECHGQHGKGPSGDWRVRDADGHFPPPPLDDSAHAWHHPTAVLLQVIREGSPQDQGKMPGWQDKLSEQEMQDVVAYIKSLWSDEVYRLWWKMEQQSLEP